MAIKDPNAIKKSDKDRLREDMEATLKDDIEYEEKEKALEKRKKLARIEWLYKNGLEEIPGTNGETRIGSIEKPEPVEKQGKNLQDIYDREIESWFATWNDLRIKQLKNEEQKKLREEIKEEIKAPDKRNYRTLYHKVNNVYVLQLDKYFMFKDYPPPDGFKKMIEDMGETKDVDIEKTKKYYDEWWINNKELLNKINLEKAFKGK